MKIKISISNIEEKKYSNMEYNDILDEKLDEIEQELNKLNSKNQIEIKDKDIDILDDEIKNHQNVKQKIKKLL